MKQKKTKKTKKNKNEIHHDISADDFKKALEDEIQWKLMFMYGSQ